jgi:ABC-type oligopeptide transport system substrate-binding subunit
VLHFVSELRLCVYGCKSGTGGSVARKRRSAAKALDRILLWNKYVVPQWSFNKPRTARWDRFSHPDPLPKYGTSAFPRLWWWDANKAAKTGSP